MPRLIRLRDLMSINDVPRVFGLREMMLNLLSQCKHALEFTNSDGGYGLTTRIRDIECLGNAFAATIVDDKLQLCTWRSGCFGRV